MLRGCDEQLRDFMKVMEDVSGRELKYYFDCWLRQPEHLKLKVNVNYGSEIMLIEYKQLQKKRFSEELEIVIHYVDGSTRTFSPFIRLDQESFELDLEKKIEKIEFDPNKKLLYELDLTIEKY